MNARVASVAGVEPAPSATEPLMDGESRELLRDLRRTGPAHDAAVGRLHALLLRAARFEVARRRATLPHVRGGDFVRTFGIPSKLEGAVRVALGGRTRTIDVGRAAYDTWTGPPGCTR